MTRINLTSDTTWYADAVIYQVYPRSFQDSDGDGIGDINGLRNRLDYLNDGAGGGLGIDCIWISPFYRSPMKDFGYDISDYQSVDPVFGTLEDFDAMLTEAHDRGIRVMVDLVPNHSSDQHPWFQESVSSLDNDKRDWYIWRDAKPDGSAPNNWLSVFGGPAWQWDETTQQYYLHSFLKEQPDLNWENPAVRQAMTDVMRFWLDKGVDGFRVDAIDFMGKDPAYADEPVNPQHTGDPEDHGALQHIYTQGAGNYFDYLRELAAVVGEYPDRILIFESYNVARQRPDLTWRFYTQIDKPYSMPFNFELMLMNWSLDDIRAFLDAFQAGLRPEDIPVYVLGNHDQTRFSTRVGQDAARAAAVLLLSLPGICLIYNGDEIGMEDVSIPAAKRTDADDRDKCRTPMQWSAEPNAGFSSRAPWLPLADDFAERNVAAQFADTDSILNLYRTLIKLRHATPALVRGTYRPGPVIEGTLSFWREVEDDQILVLINFTDTPIDASDQAGHSLILSNLPQPDTFDGHLAPNQAVILRPQ